MVVVEVVVLCGVLVLLAYSTHIGEWSAAVCGLLTGSTGKGRIGADIGSGTGRCLMSGYMCVESEGGGVGSFSLHVQLK